MTMHVMSFEEQSLDHRPLRDALGRFATGVTVVTTCTPEGKCEGLTANSFTAVSLDPPLVLWSLRRNAASLKSFVEAGHFAVNVLSAEQRELSHHFATRRADKFKDVAHARGFGGCPILEGGLASFECSVEMRLESGDHMILIGRVRRAAHRDGQPLIFSAGAYCTPSPMPTG
jgi:flavin reductase (DIM6/NTAB) family NADH-FMN oxidoreductase RutF